jgi:hypothetical protein
MGLVREILGQIQIKQSHHLTHRHATQWEPDRTRGGLISTRCRCSNRLWRLWRNIKWAWSGLYVAFRCAEDFLWRCAGYLGRLGDREFGMVVWGSFLFTRDIWCGFGARIRHGSAWFQVGAGENKWISAIRYMWIYGQDLIFPRNFVSL